jgi:hypothetical protein
MTNEEAELIPVRYSEHLASIRDRLPDDMRDRLTSIRLHDARIETCTLDHRQRRFGLCLRAGDTQSGYVTVDLEYDDVALDRLNVQAVRSVAGNAKSELLYDEIDVEGEYFAHRFLFWPYRAFDVYFRSVALRQTPAMAPLPGEREARYLELHAPAI